MEAANAACIPVDEYTNLILRENHNKKDNMNKKIEQKSVKVTYCKTLISILPYKYAEINVQIETG